MKLSTKILIILLLIVIIVCSYINSNQNQESFIPIINSSIRPILRRSRLNWETIALPNYNRFLKQWGIY